MEFSPSVRPGGTDDLQLNCCILLKELIKINRKKSQISKQLRNIFFSKSTAFPRRKNVKIQLVEGEGGVENAGVGSPAEPE